MYASRSVKPGQIRFWEEPADHHDRICAAKRLIMAEAIEGKASGDRNAKGTSADDRGGPGARVSNKALNASDWTAFVGPGPASAEDRKGLKSLATELGEDHKWITPQTLETARVKVDGKSIDLSVGLREIPRGRRFQPRGRTEIGGRAPRPKLTDVETRGTGRISGWAITRRSATARSAPCEPMWSLPGPPATPSTRVLPGRLSRRPRTRGANGWSRLDTDPPKPSSPYSQRTVPREDWETPARTPRFRQEVLSLVRDNSGVGPLLVLLEYKPEETVEAGYPARQGEASSRRSEMEKAEEVRNPGRGSESKASALVGAAPAPGPGR